MINFEFSDKMPYCEMKTVTDIYYRKSVIMSVSMCVCVCVLFYLVANWLFRTPFNQDPIINAFNTVNQLYWVSIIQLNEIFSRNTTIRSLYRRIHSHINRLLYRLNIYISMLLQTKTTDLSFLAFCLPLACPAQNTKLICFRHS